MQDEREKSREDARDEESRHKKLRDGKPGDEKVTPESVAREMEEEVERGEKIFYRLWRRAKEQDDYQNWTPWLVIRYAENDLGFRPIPSGTAHWKSPDIWIESSDPLGNAVAEEENFVHARVFNLGMAPAAPVKVDFYWANPALGLGADNMNLIGTEHVPRIGSLRAVDVRCNTPWIPEFLNDGHECLMVNSTNRILDPIHHPFQPKLDRHVGQRNIKVVEAAAGDIVDFGLLVNNLFPFRAEAFVFASTMRMRATGRALEKFETRELVLKALTLSVGPAPSAFALAQMYREGTPAHRVASRWAQQNQQPARHKEEPLLHRQYDQPSLRVDAQFTRSRGLATPAEEGRHLAGLLQAEDVLKGKGGCSTGSSHLQQQVLKPFEQQELQLQLAVPADAASGDFFVCNLEYRMHDITTGGYSVVMVVP